MLGGQPPRPPGRDYACHSVGQKTVFSADLAGFCMQAMLKKTKNVPKMTSWKQNLDKSGDGLHRCIIQLVLPQLVPDSPIRFYIAPAPTSTHDIRNRQLFGTSHSVLHRRDRKVPKIREALRIRRAGAVGEGVRGDCPLRAHNQEGRSSAEVDHESASTPTFGTPRIRT